MIFVRETGSASHYAIRLCRHLVHHQKEVILYGQVSRLKKTILLQSEKIAFIEQNESNLLKHILPNFQPNQDIDFYSGFVAKPYFQRCLIDPQRMPIFKVSLETTRGCEFRCKFCYINHENGKIGKKWEIRSNKSIIQDITVYYNLGFRLFVFMDSEFIGRSNSDNRIKELASEIIELFPDINFMVYARADTIIESRAIDILKKAGLINIFIGVESFFQNDLTRLKKRN